MTHVHAHVHSASAEPDPTHQRAYHAHTHGALAVGVLHGLAGSAHLFAVLPALALPGMTASLGYLGGYGVGTIAGMTGFAGGLGVLAHRLGHRAAPRWLLSACSAAAVIVGVAWLGA